MWFADFRLVLPEQTLEHASIRLEGGRITDIADRVVQNAAVRGNGLTLLPGLVDVHGDMLEREIEPRTKAVLPFDLALFELDKRLVATGVTTAFAAVSFHHLGDSATRSEERGRQIVLTVNRLRESLFTDFYIHARFEVTNPDVGPVLTSLIEQDQVQLLSLTDHTPGQGQYRDIEKYIETMIEWRRMRTGVARAEDELRAEIAEAQRRP